MGRRALGRQQRELRSRTAPAQGGSRSATRFTLLVVAAVLALAGCQARRPLRAPDAGAGSPVVAAATVAEDAPPERPEVPCPVADKTDLDGALDEAAHRFERGDHLTALACAEQAARIAPRSVEAHHDRADALVALDRLDEARTAYTLALALDPEDPQTLAGAADFYINRLTADHDQLLIGLEYARRGSGHVGRRREDRELLARLALLEAEALDDLARSDEALPRAEAALKVMPESAEAKFQRAVILFHLCKLERAKVQFQEILAAHPDDAFAHHHLGLILERDGEARAADAELHFARARALLPAQFPTPVLPTQAEFASMVEAAIASLDPAAKNALSTVKLEIEDLPAMDDLTGNDPPFPPTILGLYRDDEDGSSSKKSIVLYRKNLARAAATRAELEKQVRITLLHELGHLAGADEDELRAKGFE